MPKPFIGITTYLQQAQTGVWDVRAAFLPEVYFAAVERAGGIPLLLPPQPLDGGVAEQVIARIDGLIIAGGLDVEPSRYGAEASPESDPPSRIRDDWDDALLTEAIRVDLPLPGHLSGHPGAQCESRRHAASAPSRCDRRRPVQRGSGRLRSERGGHPRGVSGRRHPGPRGPRDQELSPPGDRPARRRAHGHGRNRPARSCRPWRSRAPPSGSACSGIPSRMLRPMGACSRGSSTRPGRPNPGESREFHHPDQSRRRDRHPGGEAHLARRGGCGGPPSGRGASGLGGARSGRPGAGAPAIRRRRRHGGRGARRARGLETRGIRSDPPDGRPGTCATCSTTTRGPPSG